MATLTLKRGTTFRAQMTLRFNVTGYTLSGSVWRRSTHLSDLSVRVIDEPSGWVEVEASAAETETWPISLCRADLKCVLGAEVVKSETFNIEVIT